MTNWPYPRVLAHRGGGALAPENTLAAIRRGAALGFRGVEFDVRLAADGTLVLIHDASLERTTDGRGEVAALRYAELAALDAGAWMGEAWRGERIPRFEEAGRLCRELGLAANVEIKVVAAGERAAGEAAARLARELWRGAALQPLLSSFYPDALAGAREAAPELPRGLIVGRSTPAGWRELLPSLGCVSVHANHLILDEALLRGCHGAGLAVLAWTVDDPADARRLLGWGVDGLITDALETIGPDFR